MKCVRKPLRWWPMLLVGEVLALAGATGCEAGRQFRAAAGPSLQTGVTAIVNGVLDGLFAVFEPDTTVGSDTSDSSTDTSNT